MVAHTGPVLGNEPTDRGGIEPDQLPDGAVGFLNKRFARGKRFAHNKLDKRLSRARAFFAHYRLNRHIFSAEKRYTDRLSGRSLTDPASIPTDDVDALFQFSRQSRLGLLELIGTLPVQDWDTPQDFTIVNRALRATPRKIVLHVLVHEIRHWAQIATLLRLEGLTVGSHDALLSPVLASDVTPGQGIS